MAWHEPNNGSNGRNNDPWGTKNRGGRSQGPPDLDEVFNKLTKKFSGRFSSKKGSKGSSSGGKNIWSFSIIIVISIIIWFFSGFYTIGEAERGVVLRLGKYNRIVGPGLNWRPRFIDEYKAVNVQSIRSLRASGLMLTKDENVVTVGMDIQYRVSEPYKYLYQVTNADDSLRQATDSALRAVIGDSLMDNILTSGRQQIRQNTQRTLNQIVDNYDMGLIIVDVNFQSARPPEQVKDAFDDAIAAREDEERFEREAEAYRNDILPKATGRAERLKKEALGYSERVTNEALGQVAQFEKLLPEYILAPKITRNRLYLDTMEEVYSNTFKVLIDSESTGNLLYLPIDKLLREESSKIENRQKNKSSSAYDEIELESQERNELPSSQSGSTNSRHGRY
ncbi:protein HflK [Candidatus Photodesmus katoptron]|uniref:Protein HflK n=1 Tax=Candidatus Photodesmus katoptron Akat1 TaxID=1236703 RepID=S3DJV2_9GAMM|nr:FtsH protease activity modulator HflK [Candidatus Photodesmus katoptron]EPE38000.1 hflK protein [Candidatus Photodesmus katoptron Akat1]KEY90740.1 protein HflK [Candidatus Photodesmus katoptron]